MAVKKVPKSQAKAKSTPKAAPKAAGSNKPKHTDEQSEQEQKKEPPKKKGKETLKDQAMKWVDNLDKPEDEEKDNTTEAKAEERDRQKAQKFRKLEKAGALPAEVKEAFDAAEKSQNPRANKTQLINSLFRKEGNNFVMVPKDTAFKRVQKLLDVKYGKEEAQSFPWSIMLYDKFGGNESALEKALQCGDVVVTSYQGKDYCSYSTLKSGRMKSLGDESELNDGQHSLDESSHQVISDWFKSLNVGSLQQQVEDSAEAAGDTVLVLTKPKTQEVDWNHVEKVLQSAKVAQEKLIRDGMKLKEQVLAAKDQDLLDTFKGSLKDLQDNDKDLDHCLLWKELPGGKKWDVASGKDWMTNLAKQTQKANEKIEGVKTTLKVPYVVAHRHAAGNFATGILLVKLSAAAKIGKVVAHSGCPVVKGAPAPGWIGDWLGFHSLMAYFWLWNLPHRMLLPLTYSQIMGKEEEYTMLHSVLVFDALCAHVRFDGLSSLVLVRELGSVCGFEEGECTLCWVGAFPSFPTQLCNSTATWKVVDSVKGVVREGSYTVQDVEDPAYKKPSDCKNISLFQKLSLTKALV
ncbi:unnamed protein product [Cladocopium goreaui]|uniref:Uncharacterized protein n=1 Tax=Cladocopium goreaui TaxID=2562237 RepID=A0A9P1CA39_9DINO|nr:unnamed protein product [Cladocopium goreaui]